MSSTRLYILGALADGGEMHGHQLRQLAELEHVDQWTDISVGALYGTLKRLAAEGLIEAARTEQIGGYPERVVYRITAPGRSALGTLRAEGLTTVAIRPDPFDLALARLDLDAADGLPELLRNRIAELESQLADGEAHVSRIRQYLSSLEAMVMRHRADRLRAEIRWHHDLLEALPALLDEERARKDLP